MTTTRPTALRAHRTRRLLRASPVAAAVSTLLLSAGGVQAQQADAAQTVVVTGIRRGIETSVATKRNSESIVEAVSSEDIGKLPDVSIAESLARLPGLAGQRVAGRAQVIAIRGMSPDFAGTLLNGRQQVTTGDNRSVEFDQFPSELINSATVYKTPDASIIGQGLSGTVDLRTIRPLDLSARAVSLNARIESNSQGALNAGTDSKGKRFSVSYIDQFADRTIGVAVGFAHLDSPGQELHYKAWGYSEYVSPCRADWGCAGVTGVPVGTTYLNGYEATAVSRTQTRDGLMGVFEFKPNKDVHSIVDLYYSKFKKDETMRGLMGGLGDGWSGRPGVAYTDIGTTAVGGSTTLMNSATGSGATWTVRNDLNTRDDELKAFGWNTKVRFSDAWTGVADLSYSRADRKENVIETYAGAGVGGFAINIPTGPGFPKIVPTLNYADAATVVLSDPQRDWGHDGLWKKPKAKDEMKSLRFEARRDFAGGAFSGVDLGLNYTTRQKDREMNETAAFLKDAEGVTRAPVVVDADLLRAPTSLAFAGIPGVLAYDVMGALGRYYDIRPQAEDQIINRNYEVKEKVTTAFAKLGIDTKLGELPLTGNLGVQFVHTQQSSHGFSRLSGTVSETTRGTSYSDVLPSLNLKADLGGNRVLRMGLAKTLARGRMDDMRAGAEVSISTGSVPTWSGSGGNPMLEPWRAKSLDVSMEQYFGKRSYVAGAMFYKKLDTYIYTQRLPMDFSGIPNTTSLTPASNIGEFSRPMNGKGGDVQGVELSASLEGGLVSPALDGFGVLGSLSLTESNVSPNGPGTKESLPGLSGTVAGLTAFYEKDGFSVRISQRYRSAFRGEINGLHNAREFTEILADRQTDFQIGYEFNSGTFKGLSLLLQINNLTNSPYATRQGNGFGDVIAPLEYNKYGRQTLFGVNYRL